MCLCPDLYEIGGGGEKNSGHCRPSKVLRCVFAVVTRVLVVCLHPYEGCEGHKTCARAQQTHRAPWRADTNVGKRVPIFWVLGGGSRRRFIEI